MKEEYKKTYQVDNLKTQKREFFDKIHIQKQDIERTYQDDEFWTKVSYTAKGWWSNDNFTLRREKTVSRFGNDGAWEVSWSSGGFEGNINIIDRLETVQQIMEDMKHFLEDRLSEYQLIKELIDTVKETCEETTRLDFDPHFYMKVLQAEGALERIKDSAQSVENFVDSLQRKFKREK